MPTNFNIQMPDELVKEIDKAIEKSDPFENRSQYVRAAIREKLQRDAKLKLAEKPN
jgi:Arc/MetJ-type ribon-helix-helix transcriptional regulator